MESYVQVSKYCFIGDFFGGGGLCHLHTVWLTGQGMRICDFSSNSRLGIQARSVVIRFSTLFFCIGVRVSLTDTSHNSRLNPQRRIIRVRRSPLLLQDARWSYSVVHTDRFGQGLGLCPWFCCVCCMKTIDSGQFVSVVLVACCVWIMWTGVGSACCCNFPLWPPFSRLSSVDRTVCVKCDDVWVKTNACRL